MRHLSWHLEIALKIIDRFEFDLTGCAKTPEKSELRWKKYRLEKCVTWEPSKYTKGFGKQKRDKIQWSPKDRLDLGSENCSRDHDIRILLRIDEPPFLTAKQHQHPQRTSLSARARGYRYLLMVQLVL
jgi:hypothetical protein